MNHQQPKRDQLYQELLVAMKKMDFLIESAI